MYSCLTCYTRTGHLHDFSCLGRSGDVEHNVVIAGVHITGLQDGSSQKSRLAFRKLQHHICNEEGRAVIFGQDVDGKLVSSLMQTIGNPEDYVIFGSVAVIVVVSYHTFLNIIYSEQKAFSTYIKHRIAVKSSV